MVRGRCTDLDRAVLLPDAGESRDSGDVDPVGERRDRYPDDGEDRVGGAPRLFCQGGLRPKFE